MLGQSRLTETLPTLQLINWLMVGCILSLDFFKLTTVHSVLRAANQCQSDLHNVANKAN